MSRTGNPKGRDASSAKRRQRRKEREALGHAIGIRMKDLLALHGLTVTEAAKRAGVPQPTLWRICEGMSGMPNADAIVRLARRFGTSPEWLLRGEGSEPTFINTPVESYQRLAQLLERLAAPPRVSTGILDTVMAALSFVPAIMWGTRTSGQQDDISRIAGFVSKQSGAAVRAFAEAWCMMLESAIAQYGEDHVRSFLTSDKPWPQYFAAMGTRALKNDGMSNIRHLALSPEATGQPVNEGPPSDQASSRPVAPLEQRGSSRTKPADHEATKRSW